MTTTPASASAARDVPMATMRGDSDGCGINAIATNTAATIPPNHGSQPYTRNSGMLLGIIAYGSISANNRPAINASGQRRRGRNTTPTMNAASASTLGTSA